MEILRLFDLMDHLLEKYPKEDILAGKSNDAWLKYSSAGYKKLSTQASLLFLSLGLNPGDKVVTVMNNCPDWNFIDMGLAQAGMIHIPVYPGISEEEYTWIFQHSEARLIIVGEEALYDRIAPSIVKNPQIRMVYCVSPVKDLPVISELIRTFRANEEDMQRLEKIRDGIRGEDLVTIIYTSGTTGKSKGVMLSHQNLISNAIATSAIQPLNHNHRILSFLPLCHVYERMLNYHYQYLGISIYYAENIGTIAINLRETGAHGFGTVPRLLESIYDKIVAKGKDLGGFKKMVFFWALRLALKFEINRANGSWYHFRLRIADHLVYKKWRESLGGNVSIIICGGSAIQVRLLRLFWAAGFRVVEGYGLTETSPVIAVNYPESPRIRFGTVGPILDKVEVKIADDGEILCKGPGVMLGYYKDPDYTSQVIDLYGWFHTGDIGRMEEGGFLKITDRKKEIFKNSGGKYIAPQVIENKMKESIFIEQVIVAGENEKFAAAVISPNFNHLHFWAAKHKIHFRDNRELISKPIVVARFQREVNQINESLSAHEQIKRFRLVHEEWGTATGELSPTLKLRRKVLYDKYDWILREIYSYSPDEINRAVKE